MKQLQHGLYIPKHDSFFVNRDFYEQEYYNAVTHNLPHKRTAIDVGAHIGFWSHRLVNDFDYVHSFEPIPDHYECLQKNTESATNIKTHHMGVSDMAGDLYFEQVFDNSGCSKISKTPTNIKVFVDSLDNTLKNISDVDFIKIDVEGWEINVLQGAENILKNNDVTVFCEILNRHKQNSPVFAYMNSLGYNCVQQIAENYIFKK